MRIRQVAVSDLFGMFNHKVSISPEHVTIIYGPNGFGKTALLKMLNALFSQTYNELRQIPFRELSVEFADSSSLMVKKRTPDPSAPRKKPAELEFSYRKPGHQAQSYLYKGVRQERFQMHFPPSAIARELPFLDQIGPDTWVDQRNQEVLSVEDVLERYQGDLPMLPPSMRQKEADWLSHIKESVPVRFIDTQRLLTLKTKRDRDYGATPQMVPSIASYSQELVAEIQTKLTEYAALSQSLDRTFPTRLVQAERGTELSQRQLRKNLDGLEQKRSRLIKSGLLDPGQGSDLGQLDKIDDRNRSVLSVYVGDNEQKLRVLDQLADKIELLAKVINGRFLYKKMSIDRKEGFVFTTDDGRMLAPTSLSSGEQHEVVLFYELLFKVRANSLVLMDEPEISLHVAWQQGFVNDLLDITKVTEFDVIMATHSPQIIHDRWDLTVELVGPR